MRYKSATATTILCLDLFPVVIIFLHWLCFGTINPVIYWVLTYVLSTHFWPHSVSRNVRKHTANFRELHKSLDQDLLQNFKGSCVVHAKFGEILPPNFIETVQSCLQSNRLSGTTGRIFLFD